LECGRKNKYSDSDSGWKPPEKTMRREGPGASTKTLRRYRV
jgi:hypothetical protein